MTDEKKNQSRRDFLKIGAAAGLGAAVAGLGLEAKERGVASIQDFLARRKEA